MNIRSLWLALGLLLAGAGIAQAGCPNVPTINLAADGNGNGCNSTIPQASSYQGTATIPAATNSFQLTSLNVTMGPGTTYPATFSNLLIVNTGGNPILVCWFSGTNVAGAGCEVLLANGGNDQVNLGGTTTAPSVYSALGSTISFRN